jgi:hypothetical protein
MTRTLAALLFTQIFLGWASSEALAQNDKTLEQVRSLGLESLPGPVPTYYSPGARARAEALQRQVREAVSFFEGRYKLPQSFSLAVLNEPHWAALRPGPYGGTFASPAPHVVGAPAFPDRGVMAKFFRAVHTAAPSPEVGQAWARLGVSHEAAVDRVMDAWVFHEVGHLYVNSALGFRDVARWFNEFMATYMAYTFLQSREPATISMWNAVALDIVHGFKPSSLSLDDFNRLGLLKGGPETYGWFQSHFNLGVTALIEQKKDADWFGELRAAGLDKDSRSLTTSELLARLDRITPGIKQWAEKLQSGQ